MKSRGLGLRRNFRLVTLLSELLIVEFVTLKISEVLLSSQGQVKIESAIFEMLVNFDDVCPFKVKFFKVSVSWLEKFQYFKKLFSKILRAPLAARAP